MSADARNNDPDDLDGCEVDFGADPVSDADLPFVILGDDPERIEEYRKLFASQADEG